MLGRTRLRNTRVAIFMLGLFLAGYATVTAVAQNKVESKNVELVGYNDLQGRSAYQPTIHKQGNRWIAYIGLHGGSAMNPLTGKVESNGTAVIDVTDPKQPKFLSHIPGGEGAGEAGGAAQQIEKGEEVASAMVVQQSTGHHKLDTPGVGENGGSDAEGDYVGERIHLSAEIAGGVGEASDSAIQAVQHDGDSNGLSRDLEIRVAAKVPGGSEQDSLDGPHDGDKSKEDVAGREQCGQCIGGAARFSCRRAWIEEPLLERELGHQTGLRRARMDDPPATCSPVLTAISHSGPRNTSTREPNFMRPTRSPFAT